MSKTDKRPTPKTTVKAVKLAPKPAVTKKAGALPFDDGSKK